MSLYLKDRSRVINDERDNPSSPYSLSFFLPPTSSPHSPFLFRMELEHRIRTALSSDTCYQFSDLLSEAKESLSVPDRDRWLEILNCFVTGQYRTFTPSLDRPAREKLQAMTLLRLTSESTALGYGEIERVCGCETDREVEALLIRCIQAGLLQCKIDEINRRVFLHQLSTSAYHVQDCGKLLETLQSWASENSSVMEEIRDHVSEATVNLATAKTEREEFKRNLDSAKASVKKEKPQREVSSSKVRKRLA